MYYENIARQNRTGAKFVNSSSVYPDRNPKINNRGYNFGKSSASYEYNGAAGSRTKSPHFRPL